MRFDVIDHLTLMQVSGGAIRVRAAPTDPTTKSAMETVKTAVEDLVRDQKTSGTDTSTMLPMMMMMMRR
jgi:hypothetical protein